MNYAKIIPYDTGNWDGITTTIFFSGCTLNCPGCFNKELHDFNYGEKFTYETEQQLIRYAKSPHVTGICLLGGELFQQDLYWLFILVKRLKYTVKKPIHMWSGYTFEELIQDRKKEIILAHATTLVDGRFIESKRDINLKYRGSTNQRVLDVQASLKAGHAVELFN